MAKHKSKAVDIKKIAFLNCGPKLTPQELDALPVQLPDYYRDFLLVHNGGTPVNNAFRYPFKGRENISTIDFFYSVRPQSNRYPYDNLIYDGFLHHRNDLPRWSIPIARVDEDPFVLIFEDGPYRDGVWYFIWIHDDPDSEPIVECKGAIEKVSDSIPEFLAMLRSYADFYSIVSYIVPPEISLSEIKQGTKPLGLEWVEYDDSRGNFARCDWDLLRDKTFLSTTLFLVNNDSIPSADQSTHIADLKLPRINAPKHTTVMHLLVSAQFSQAATSKLPKEIGGWTLKPIENRT
jgi:hypothetical protein